MTTRRECRGIFISFPGIVASEGRINFVVPTLCKGRQDACGGVITPRITDYILFNVYGNVSILTNKQQMLSIFIADKVLPPPRKIEGRGHLEHLICCFNSNFSNNQFTN